MPPHKGIVHAKNVLIGHNITLSAKTSQTRVVIDINQNKHPLSKLANSFSSQGHQLGRARHFDAVQLACIEAKRIDFQNKGTKIIIRAVEEEET